MRMPWTTSAATSVEEALAEGDIAAAVRVCRRRGWHERALELLASAGDDEACIDERVWAASEALGRDHALAALAECALIAAARPDDERIRPILVRIASKGDGPRDRCRAPFFDQIGEASLGEILDRVAVRRLRAGETLAATDVSDEALVFVARGEIALTGRNSAGERVELERLGEGGIVRPARAEAGVRGAMATRATQVLVLRCRVLEAIAARRPDVARAFREVLIEPALR